MPSKTLDPITNSTNSSILTLIKMANNEDERKNPPRKGSKKLASRPPSVIRDAPADAYTIFAAPASAPVADFRAALQGQGSISKQTPQTGRFECKFSLFNSRSHRLHILLSSSHLERLLTIAIQPPTLAQLLRTPLLMLACLLAISLAVLSMRLLPLASPI